MPIVREEQVVARQIQIAVSHIAKAEGEKVGKTEAILAKWLWDDEQLIRGITRLKYPTSMPKKIDGGVLFAIAYRALQTGTLDLNWFTILLQGIDIPTANPMTPDYFFSILSQAQHQVPSLTTEDIQEVVKRYFPDWNMNDDMPRFEIDSSFSGKYLVGEYQVIEYLDYLHRRDLRHQLRTVVYGAVKSPEKLGDLIVLYLKEAKEQGIYIKFNAVLVLDPVVLSQEFFDAIDKRLAFYEEHDITDRLELRILFREEPIGTDIVTIDDKHLILTLADEIGEDLVYTAIIMENIPEMVTNFTSWFDKSVYPHSQSYQDVRADFYND